MKAVSPLGEIVVVHSLPVWLPLTATWLYSQVRRLPPRVASHIVCERTEHLEQFSIANLHSLRERSSWRYLTARVLRKLRVQRYLGELVRVARGSGAQILHSHWGDTGWRDMGASRRAGVAHVVSFYGKDVNFFPTQDRRWHRRYRDLFAHVDLVLCEGPHMAQCILRLGCPHEKLKVHPLGIEVARIPFQPRQWRPGEPLRILIAASFREKKGIPDALEALARLRSDGAGVDITIVGDESADPRSRVEKARILGAIHRLGLAACTHLLGYQPHAVLLEEAYRHHIFLSPSLTAGDGDTEGGAPVSLIEMSATGMPVVSTFHCDIPTVVIHGRTGLLAAERDVDGLVAHLRHLIARPDLWADIVQAARRHVEERFDAVKQSERLYETYASLLEASSATSGVSYMVVPR